MVNEIYALANTAESTDALARGESLIQKRKVDTSVFTIADGLVQAILTRTFFRGSFADVVGEEDSSEVVIERKPYRVGSLLVPSSLDATISKALKDVEDLSTQINTKSFEGTTVFIDPIDGTREFTSGLGEHCTIMIGFVESETPVAGLIYRPITTPTQWVAGCSSEAYYEPSQLDLKHLCNTTTSTSVDPRQGFLTSNGSISPFVAQLIEELGMERVRAGGVGNKVMCLLEGKAECYIQDRGVCRWDTAAAQAVLEASSGMLLQMRPFVDGSGTSSSSGAMYMYKALSPGEVNPDIASYSAISENLHPICTRHNLIDAESSDYQALESKSSGPLRVTRITANLVKPYANLCGIFALKRNSGEELNKYVQALRKVAARETPRFS